MTVLGKEILKGAWGTEDRMMQATWRVTATDAGNVKVTMVGSEGDDYPSRPHTSLSPTLHASTSTGWHTTGYQTPHSPSYSPHYSPSQNHHS